MRRSVIVALATVGALLLAAGAQAKAPPDGVDVCGAHGSCAHLTTAQVEGEWALFEAADSTVSVPRVGPFYALAWSWGGDTPTRHGYYVPRAGETRQVAGDGSVVWQALGHPAAVRALVAGVAPFPAPVFTRVTVGGRAARDPRSYTRLFERGEDALPIILPAWIPIGLAADEPSPWTDPGADVRISRRGRLLWENGSIVRIPLRLAREARAGKPLR